MCKDTRSTVRTVNQTKCLFCFVSDYGLDVFLKAPPTFCLATTEDMKAEMLTYLYGSIQHLKYLNIPMVYSLTRYYRLPLAATLVLLLLIVDYNVIQIISPRSKSGNGFGLKFILQDDSFIFTINMIKLKFQPEPFETITLLLEFQPFQTIK